MPAKQSSFIPPGPSGAVPPSSGSAIGKLTGTLTGTLTGAQTGTLTGAQTDPLPRAPTRPAGERLRPPRAARLQVAEDASAWLARPASAGRIDADLAELNLSFLHVARELSRSAREIAVTRLGLDAEACAALDQLSVADLHAIAHSRTLIFSLRVAPGELSAQAQLARYDPVASEARLVLAAERV